MSRPWIFPKFYFVFFFMSNELRAAINSFLRENMQAKPDHFITARRIRQAFGGDKHFDRILREELPRVFGDAKPARTGPLVGFRGVELVKR